MPAAVDLLFSRMQAKGFAFNHVRGLRWLQRKDGSSTSCGLLKVMAVSGSGQQHGSVYWATGAQKRLRALNPAEPMAPQLKEAFRFPDCPMWMDSSTEEQCQ